MREFIGVYTKIVDSDNKSQIGLEGKIVDETKNTFRIATKKGEKTVIKKNSTFVFIIKNRKIKVSGKLLTKRPEERLKLKVK